MRLRILDEKLVCRADICERAGPSAAVIADAAIFEVRCGQSFRCQRGAQMPRMIEIVFRAPISSVDVDHEADGLRFFWRGQPQIEELVWIRSVREPEIGWRRRLRQDVFRHETFYAASPERTEVSTFVRMFMTSLRTRRNLRALPRLPG